MATVQLHVLQLDGFLLTLGACARVTVVVVCVSVTMLAATYLVYKSQARCYKVPCAI